MASSCEDAPGWVQNMRSERPRASGEEAGIISIPTGHGLAKWRGVLLGYLAASFRAYQ